MTEQSIFANNFLQRDAVEANMASGSYGHVPQAWDLPLDVILEAMHNTEDVRYTAPAFELNHPSTHIGSTMYDKTIDDSFLRSFYTACASEMRGSRDWDTLPTSVRETQGLPDAPIQIPSAPLQTPYPTSDLTPAFEYSQHPTAEYRSNATDLIIPLEDYFLSLPTEIQGFSIPSNFPSHWTAPQNQAQFNFGGNVVKQQSFDSLQFFQPLGVQEPVDWSNLDSLWSSLDSVDAPNNSHQLLNNSFDFSRPSSPTPSSTHSSQSSSSSSCSPRLSRSSLPFSASSFPSGSLSAPVSRHSSVERTHHSGKSCAHCKATSTPLWRRDPMTLKRLCNACGLYLQQRNKLRPQGLIDADNDDEDEAEVQARNPSGPECSHCHTRNTSVWRRSKEGAQLCNACGVYQRLRGRDRPLSLKRNKIKPRSKHSERKS